MTETATSHRLIKGRKWDVVIDTCGYVPRIVEKSAELLADCVEHYTFISSIDEDALLATMKDESVEEITNETYGPLKVLCEKAAEQVMPGSVLVIRSGLIVRTTRPPE